MMMKKLSEEHYIICDDSEIKEGDFVYSSDGGIFKRYIDNHCQTVFPISKVTHSTQPLELICCTPEGQIKRYIDCKGCDRGTLGYNEVKLLSLSEVKELLGEVDVEKKGEKKYPKSEFWVGSGPSRLYDENAKERRCYIEGYNQALEDNKEKKYTEEDMRKMWKFGYNERNLDDSIESFQHKTEWEVEFIDGRLKLKS